MKKLLLLSFSGALMLGIFSCKRDYQCNCQYKVHGVDTVEIYTYTHVKKKDAEPFCDVMDTQIKAIDPAGSCVLF